MAPSETRLSARAVADILARIFGPSFYDGPRFGVGPSVLNQRIAEVSETVFNRGSAVMLNPPSLPPRETYALALADAHIQELLSIHRVGSLLGGGGRGKGPRPVVATNCRYRRALSTMAAMANRVAPASAASLATR